MDALAQTVEAGQESAAFLAALVEHVRRVHAAQMATERLDDLANDVREAAERRGREAPEVPHLREISRDARYGLRLFNSGMVDYLLREADARIKAGVRAR